MQSSDGVYTTGAYWALFDTDELRTMLDSAQSQLSLALEDQNTQVAHDLQCLIDRVTSELENRDD